MRIAIFALCLFVTGCADPLKKILDERFLPVNADTQRAKAVASLAQSLSRMELPGISIGLRIDELERILSSGGALDSGIRSLKLSGNQQLLELQLKVKRDFSKEDWGSVPAAQQILGDSALHLKADFTLSLGFTLNAEPSGGEDSVFTLKVLPAIRDIDIKGIDVSTSRGKKVEATLLANAIELVINRYSDHLAGQLGEANLLTTKIPVQMVDTIDPTGIIETGNDPKLTVALRSNEIVFPLEIGEAAVLVDDRHIRAMIALAPAGSGYAPGSGHKPSTYADARELFQTIHDTVFGKSAPEGKIWVGLTRGVVARSLNSVLNQSQACLVARTSLPQTKFSEKVRLPGKESIDCSPDRDCSPKRDCSFEKKRDRRNCSACLLRAPRICAFGGCVGGHCVQRGNDPFCEAAKGAQNAAYEAAYIGRKLDCERIKEQNRIACEAEKATEKGLCEAGREIVGAISGNAASIKGHIVGEADLEMCLENISIASDISRIKSQFRLQGGANVSGRLEVIPLEAIGHLICQMPTSSKFDFSVDIPPHSQALDLDLTLGEVDGEFGASFATQELEVPLRLTPTPVDWLLNNRDMTFKCQGLNLLRPLIVAANAFLPELGSSLVHRQPSTQGFIEIQIPEQVLAEQAVKLQPAVTPESLFLYSED